MPIQPPVAHSSKHLYSLYSRLPAILNIYVNLNRIVCYYYFVHLFPFVYEVTDALHRSSFL
jgi:hypothetical protein